MGGGSEVGLIMRHQQLVSFLRSVRNVLTSLTFFSVKIALAAPKIIYLVTYEIFFNELAYANLVKGVDQHAERTDTIASTILKLY